MSKIKKKLSKTRIFTSNDEMIFSLDDTSDTDSKLKSKKKKKSSLDGNGLQSENSLDSGSSKNKKIKKKKELNKPENIIDEISNNKLSPNLLSVSPTQKVTIRKYKLLENELRSKDKSFLSDTDSRASKAKEMIESMYSTSPTSLAALISQSKSNEKNSIENLQDQNPKSMKMKYRLSAPPTKISNESNDHITKRNESFNINLLKKYGSPSVIKEELQEINVQRGDIDENQKLENLVREEENKTQQNEPKKAIISKSEIILSPRRLEDIIEDNNIDTLNSEPNCNSPERKAKTCSEHLKAFKEKCIDEMKKIHELNNNISNLSSDIDELESASQRIQTHLEITRQNAQNIGILIQDSKIKVDNSLNYIKESKKRDNQRIFLSLLSLLLLLIATIVWFVSAIFLNIRLLFLHIYCYIKNEHKNGNNKLNSNTDISSKICCVNNDQDILEELETLEDMSSSIKNLIKLNEEKDKKNKQNVQCI